MTVVLLRVLAGGALWFAVGYLLARLLGRAITLADQAVLHVDQLGDEALIRRIANGEDVEADDVTAMLTAWRDDVRRGGEAS
jgi:hypothetical protein